MNMLRSNANAGENIDNQLLTQSRFPAKSARSEPGDWAMDIGSGATVGAGQYPAKYSFLTGTANCASASTPDFVVYNTSLAGSGTQASIIAFDNLYSGCTGTSKPSVYWAYNTGGTIRTSVVLSADGTQVAFVHSSASGSSLVVLRWVSGQGATAGSGSAAASPATPGTSSTTGSAYNTCKGGSGSCQLTLAFSGTAANVTNSAPYYDYAADALYVGADSGVLHKFTGVFNGVAAEVASGGWPLTVSTSSSKVLTSPVFDVNTKNIFVADLTGVLWYVRDTGSTTGTCASGSPPCKGSTSQAMNGPIAEGPMIDESTQKVFAFAGWNNTNLEYQVLQTDEALTTSANKSINFTGVTGKTYTSYMRLGAFDNLYFGSPASGHLYVCAPNTPNSPGYYNGATLYQIGFATGGVMNTSTSGSLTMVSASLANNAVADDCSPLTEFQNGSTDYLFLSVTQSASLAHCTGSATAGCLYSFDVTSGTMPTTTVAGATATGGTSGIVIDNSVASSPTGASQVYFTPLANQSCAGNGTTGNATGGCAIQASQSGLN
jgi:hypothetical protein